MIPQKWTYVPTLPTTRDKVRFFIGDNDDQNKIFDDGEIDAMLSLESNIYLAAALLADQLAARYASEANVSVDGLSVSSSNKTEKYRTLAAQLRERAISTGGGIGMPFVGGISLSTMQSVDQDTDRNPSKFKIGQNSFVQDGSFVERDFTSQ